MLLKVEVVLDWMESNLRRAVCKGDLILEDICHKEILGVNFDVAA